MRNGSKTEYFHVEGALKLTRVRQSEWRRRWGIKAVTVFDATTPTDADDGHSESGGGFSAADSSMISGGTAVVWDSFARFTNVTIPGGATIVSAYMTVEGNGNNVGTAQKTNIYMEDSDDAVAPTTNAEHSADVRTSTSTPWDDFGAMTAGVEYNSPDIAAVVQEIVDRGSWASGNAMMILWDDRGSAATNYGRVRTHDHGSSNGSKLHVEYTT